LSKYLMSRRYYWIRYVIGIWMAFSIAACGGGGAKSPTEPSVVTGVQPATIKATFDKSQVNSDAKTPVTITALVRDVNNNALKDQAVTFTTTDPGVTLVSLGAQTDSAGKTSATIVPDIDPTNRIITVTATAGSLSSSVQIQVVGTTLSISGSTSIVSGNSTPVTLLLKNSAGEPLFNRTVNLNTSRNSLAAASGTSCTGTGTAINCTTDVNGQVTVNFGAVTAGADTLTASSLGTTASLGITVSGDNFVFTSPGPGTKPDVALGASQTISVKYVVNGVAQAGAPITFSTTRGTLSDPSATPTSGTTIAKSTDGTGIATVSVASTSQVGEATITASASGGNPTAQGKLEFISISPAAVSLQSSPATLSVSRAGSPASQSEIIALVRDSANNPVKNVDVTFNIVTDGSGAGSSIGQTAKTNSFGQASVFYTAGFSPSGQDGVLLRATIPTSPITTATATTALTVTGTVFIITGFDNLISISPSSSTVYEKEFVDIVTNSASNPVANQAITLQMQPRKYYKGNYFVSGQKWVQNITASCDNEDINNNGVLDGSETDFNGNQQIDPRFPGTLTGTTSPSGNTTTTTDTVGVAKFKLNYPKNYATWIDMKIISKTVVGGSESSSAITLNLPVLASELASPDVRPSNIDSPFGSSSDCSNPN
jgi:Bacterial Ig-like domain (group 1)